MSSPVTIPNPHAHNMPVDLSILFTAISDLADLDRHVASDVGPRLTCSEVDALATVLAAAGHYDSAADWIEGHSDEDEDGDNEGHRHVQSLITSNGCLGGDEAQLAAHSYVQTLVA